MGHIIASVATHFSTQFDLDQVRAFFADKDVGAGKLVVKQTLEQIQVVRSTLFLETPKNGRFLKKVNIEFRRQSEKGVDAWLDQHYPPSTPSSA